jgi:hypothetical protein
MTARRLLTGLFALSIIAASCGDDSGDTLVADVAPPAEDVVDDSGDTLVADDDPPAEDVVDDSGTAADETPDDTSGDAGLGPAFSDEGRSIDAPEAVIVVDADISDWAEIDGVDMTLFPISGESFETHESTLKVAHDNDFVYVLFTIDDDYDWNAEDHKLTASSAIQWAVDPGAGEAMGSTDEDREVSLGLVDIWHWEIDCASGQQSGGAVSDPGDGNDPGDDGPCNFDDEYATATEDREDDDGDGAENNLLGAWTHTASVADADGTWIFEMSRPLDTGDAQDAQFQVGSSALVAAAYWDADSGPDGWEAEFHVQTANQGWITVNFL